VAAHLNREEMSWYQYDKVGRSYTKHKHHIEYIDPWEFEKLMKPYVVVPKWVVDGRKRR